MSVKDIKQLDIVGFNQLKKQFDLIIADDLDWKNEEHLILLQDKINTYLSYIESGEINEKYPNSQEYKKNIKIVAKYEPDAKSKDFLDKVKDIVITAGFGFEYQVSEGTK